MQHPADDEIPVPIIVPELCTGCGLCVQVCPNGALAIQASTAVVAAPDACTYDIASKSARRRPSAGLFELHWSL